MFPNLPLERHQVSVFFPFGYFQYGRGSGNGIPFPGEEGVRKFMKN